ncbi:MAG: type II and III secretion system protein family protein, partial [Perlucidibaca sp.]
VAQAVTPAELAVLPSQVQVDIRFVELSRSRLREMGVRLARNGSNFLFGSNNVNFSDTDQLFKIPVSSSPFNILWGDSSARLGVAIDMLEQKGYAYTLSRPSLVAMSGQSATFLAGGEVPILVPQSGGGSTSAITVEYKEFGVRLSVSPTVLSKNQITLKVAPEVSELDYTNAVTLQGSTIPALRVRRTDTTLSMADGESFVISGLVSRSMRNNADKLPGLGDIPVLGAFFRSTSFDSEDSELLMIVTPRLVKPLAKDAPQPQLPGQSWQNYEPSSAKLFFQGADSPYRDAPVGFSR